MEATGLVPSPGHFSEPSNGALRVFSRLYKSLLDCTGPRPIDERGTFSI